MTTLNLSIHPRNWPAEARKMFGYSGTDKSNTCAPKGRKERAIAGLTKHLAAHPRDGVSAAHLANLSK